MKRKHLFLLFYILSILYTFAQKASVMDFDYLQFRSYFSEVYYDSMHGLELPRNTFTQRLFLTDNPQEQLYAVGVMKNKNGDDHFIIHRIIGDQNLEYSSIVVFRNEQLLSDSLHEIIIENAPDSDGGIFNQFYEIENETIKTNIFWSECCSSSGYNTPVAVKSSVDFILNDSAQPVVQSVDTCLFSSRFFDVDCLQTLIQKGEQYPTKEFPYILTINNWTKSIESFYSDNIELSFYIESIGNMFSTLLISKDRQGNIIDTYRIGKGSTYLNKKDSLFFDTVFKSPIIIKTSKGDVRLLPDGMFYLNI